jgi:hypothetical protein
LARRLVDDLGAGARRRHHLLAQDVVRDLALAAAVVADVRLLEIRASS